MHINKFITNRTYLFTEKVINYIEMSEFVNNVVVTEVNMHNKFIG